MRQQHKWLFTKYDAFKRPVISGTYFDNIHIEQDNMQGFITQTQSQYLWEIYDTGNHTYTNRSFPDDAYADNCEILSETYYDSYDYLQNNPDYAYADVFGVPVSGKTKSMITLSKTYILDHRNDINPEYLLTVNYYDKYGRTIQTIADNHLGGKDILSNKYNFAGELLETKQQHSVSGSPEIVINRIMQYDRAGRLLKTFEQINDEDTIEITDLTYNEKSELESKKLHSADGTNFLQEINYEYNIRGWMTYINNPENLGNDFFAMQLKYETGNNPQFNGNISAINWNSTNFNEIKTYEFDYDNINRLKTAEYTPDNRYNTEFSYDYNGNIVSLQRNGKTDNTNFGEIDNLNYIYDGNQLLKVDDARGNENQANGFSDNGSFETAEYLYDPNGNMIKDLNKNTDSILYNQLNLPETIEISDNQTNFIYYTCDAAGIKLRKTAGSTTTDYVGNFIYENGTLKYIITEYGKIIPNINTDDTTYTRQYNLTDHLGNVRVTFDENDSILQEDSYYPFGMTINGLNYPNISDEDKNLYLYNGKELQEDFGLDWYDYGARFYDAQLGRWHVPDPLAEFKFNTTPYRYGSNNPISYIDPYGLFETRKEARRYRRKHKLKGRIRRGADGGFSIDNKKNATSIF